MATVEQHTVSGALAGTDTWGAGLKTARSKEEKDMIHKYTIEQAMKGGFYGTLIGVGSNIALTRYSDVWARMHHTPRWILILAWPLVGFTIMGEHSALDLERKIAAKKSIVDVASFEKPTPLPSTPTDHLTRFAWIPTRAEFTSYITENQYKVVGMSWLTVTSLTLAALWANKNMPVSQKLIHARMYAQGTALASFAAFAFAAHAPAKTSEMDKVSEKYFQAVLEGRESGAGNSNHSGHGKPHSIGEGGVVVRGG